MPIQLEILTIERKLYDEEIDMVVVPGTEGVFGILPNHSPLVTTLNYGELLVKINGEEDQFFSVTGGFIEVRPDHITVMADAAERAEEIDIERAEAARQRTQELLQKRGDPEEFAKAQAALKRSAVRIKVAHKRRRRHERA